MFDAESSIKKIKYNKDHYVIFYVNDCPYCQNALNLLRQSSVKWKGYDIDTINGGLDSLLKVFNNHNLLTEYNKAHGVVHRTKPLIFYNGKFIGGFTDLQQLKNEGRLSS
jgi:glutaredoxin